MKYIMKSKLIRIQENFWVKNEEGKEVYFLDKKLISIGLRFDIKKDDEIVYSIKEKIIKLLPFPTYRVLNGEEKVAKVRKQLSIIKDKIKVSSNKYGDFKIKGNLFDYSYKIYKDNKVVAKVDKKIFAFTDNYGVDIDFEDEAFVLSLVVIIDDIIDKQREKKDK